MLKFSLYHLLICYRFDADSADSADKSMKNPLNPLNLCLKNYQKESSDRIFGGQSLSPFVVAVWAITKKRNILIEFPLFMGGGRWDSNPRHSEPQSDALTN